jgi:HPt (histidine-containing phosphotransfer) domain-containing protein
MGGTDPAGIKELVELYLTQTKGQINELTQAAANGAAKELERVAHKAAGASATCGMTAIVPLLRELEKLGRENRPDQAPPLVARAQEALAQIDSFLDHYLASLNSPQSELDR